MPTTPVKLIDAGAPWRFYDRGALPGSDWFSPQFDDSSWETGRARFGYGGDGEATKVGYGPDAADKHITTYFRRWFDVPDPGTAAGIRVALQRDDGAVVYLNGLEVLRSNMPGGLIEPKTVAASVVSGDSETNWFEGQLSADWLVAGTNLLAVQVHQANSTSSDLGFDLRLVALLGVPESAARLRWERLPYGALRLSWPAWLAGQLRASRGIGGAANWQPVAEAVVLTNGVRAVLIDPAAEHRFYRLQR
jgi:hypothetical protein